MTADHCELCDLPLNTCVHGRPPPAPAPVERAERRTSPQPRRVAAAKPRASTAVSTRRVTHRWTPSEDFRPHVLRILREHAGRLDAEDLMLELEIRLEDVLTPGDREQAPHGGERWHLATRRQRKALIDEGMLVPAQPGVWQLTARGLSAAE